MSVENVLRIIKNNVRNLRRSYYNESVVEVDSAFIPLCRWINGKSRFYPMPLFVDEDISPIHYDNTDTQVVSFSGGKLSLACALRYKNIGKNIVLFHIADEDENVEKLEHIADMLGVKLYVHRQHLADTVFVGMEILYLATEYALKNKCSPKIIFGYFEDASVLYNTRKDWPFCNELISAFQSLCRKYIDGYSIVNPIPNYAVMWDELLGHKKYLSYVDYRDETEERVFQNIRMDYYLDEPDKDLYLYNIERLRLRERYNKANLNDVWNKYFFYRIEKSRFFDDLMELLE